jgi:kynureninase
VFPREGEYTLRTEDIVSAIEKHADELALTLFSGVNYFTGQLYDIKAITEAAHRVGAVAGFDLAHAAGNVPLQLHEWNVDFACWCSYKYMNSGPGGISGIFVHEKHFDNRSLNRFAGWWGYREDERFLMTPGFVPDRGAAGWQVSTSPMMLLTLHKAALDIFESAGGMEPLCAKSRLLTAFLEFIIRDINQAKGEELFTIITPTDPDWRGCQLSVVCKYHAKTIFNFLTDNGVVGDWREPNVIRLAPVPLYSSFKQVFLAGRVLTSALAQVGL